jgi:hypothetical protein
MTNSDTKAKPFVLFLLVILITTAGCAANFTNFELNPQPAAKIPLRAALYLSPGLRNQRSFGNFPLGEAMSSSAEKTLKMIFKDVVVLGGTDTPQEAGVNIVISAKYENLVGTGRLNGKWDIVYKWTVVTPNGKTLYVNTITGTGSSNAFVGTTRFGNALSEAIKDHYEQLIANLVASKWWKNLER